MLTPRILDASILHNQHNAHSLIDFALLSSLLNYSMQLNSGISSHTRCFPTPTNHHVLHFGLTPMILHQMIGQSNSSTLISITTFFTVVISLPHC